MIKTWSMPSIITTTMQLTADSTVAIASQGYSTLPPSCQAVVDPFIHILPFIVAVGPIFLLRFYFPEGDKLPVWPPPSCIWFAPTLFTITITHPRHTCKYFKKVGIILEYRLAFWLQDNHHILLLLFSRFFSICKCICCMIAGFSDHMLLPLPLTDCFSS